MNLKEIKRNLWWRTRKIRRFLGIGQLRPWIPDDMKKILEIDKKYGGVRIKKGKQEEWNRRLITIRAPKIEYNSNLDTICNSFYKEKDYFKFNSIERILVKYRHNYKLLIKMNQNNGLVSECIFCNKIECNCQVNCLNPYCNFKEAIDGHWKTYCKNCGYSLDAAEYVLGIHTKKMQNIKLSKLEEQELKDAKKCVHQSK